MKQRKRLSIAIVLDEKGPNMAIKVFADGANLEGMLDMHDNGNVQGFTTNPSLMKAGGVTDYRAFAKTVLEHITDVSVLSLIHI